MTNGEKYKTAEARSEAMLLWCKLQDKSKRQTMRDGYCFECAMKWLDLEAEEEKPLPCYECGKEMITLTCKNGTPIGFAWHVECDYCYHTSGWYKTKNEAIAAHNRVAKAVMESEAK